MSNIPLTEEEKNKLEQISQSGSERIVHRARLILAYAEGKPTMQAAREAGISRGRSRFWKRQFLAKGMGIFESDENEPLSIGNLTQPEEAPDIDLLSTVQPIQNIEVEIPDNSEISFPPVLKSIGMLLDDSLAQAGRKVWLFHFAIMLSHEQGTISGEDAEELHDMRVATRRMRTAFDIFGEAFDAKIITHYLKGLKKIGGALGQVRDMDVILANGRAYQQKLEEQKMQDLEPLFSSWKREIDFKRQKLLKHLESDGYHRFKTEFSRFVQTQEETITPTAMGIETISRVRDIVPVLVYNRYARVRAFESVISNANISQLHELRIEFKKFRYTLEYFKEILGSTTGGLINEIKQYQDHLGELHDADVACRLISQFLEDWEQHQSETPIPDRTNPEPIVAYLAYQHAERYRLMVTFPNLWQKFNRPELRQNMAKAISTL